MCTRTMLKRQGAAQRHDQHNFLTSARLSDGRALTQRNKMPRCSGSGLLRFRLAYLQPFAPHVFPSGIVFEEEWVNPSRKPSEPRIDAVRCYNCPTNESQTQLATW
uniref:Uncharacterized protein n=1 Tax=Eutreptiella gymnastica TaxID=73025 RepID=A0A7S4LHN6_9EUGL